MRVECLIAHYGGSQQKAANETGVDKSTLSAWKRKGGIPFSPQCDIEILTNGVLTAKREHDPQNPFYTQEHSLTAA